MKTITVEEATRDLGGLLRRASAGEQIAISQDQYVVLLQPVFEETASFTPREALARLQHSSQVRANEAETYLQEVRSERKAAR